MSPERSRVHVVTGGTGALGSALVKLLLNAGHRVAVPYRDEESWRRLSGEANNPALTGGEVDLLDLDSTQSFIDDTARQLGAIDGLAAVAGGFAAAGTLEAAPPSEWRAMLEANLTATYNVCRTSLPHLINSRGSVVTVGSRTAETAGAGAAAYAVSKVAVSALTRVLALENRERGVRFNCVAPGTMDTPGNRAAMPQAKQSTWTPVEKVAEVIAFLLSPASAAITGGLIPVDASARIS